MAVWLEIVLGVLWLVACAAAGTWIGTWLAKRNGLR